MRVLVDECCPRAVAEALEGSGFDVLYVADVSPSATDRSLARRAQDEARIIVTQDYDFGEMAIRQNLFGAGLVLVACAALPSAQRGQRVAQVMGALGAALEGRLTIIEARRVRQRPLGEDKGQPGP